MARPPRGDRCGRARDRAAARDALTVGIITIVFGLALLSVPTQYALQYYIEEAGQTFTLTGITIGVGIFGGYAAIIAVFLAIAGFSPRRTHAADTQRGRGPTARRRGAWRHRMTEKPTRRALMKPLHLLGLAFGAALFAGVVTLVSMGFFQQRQRRPVRAGARRRADRRSASRSSSCSSVSRCCCWPSTRRRCTKTDRPSRAVRRSRR